MYGLQFEQFSNSTRKKKLFDKETIYSDDSATMIWKGQSKCASIDFNA